VPLSLTEVGLRICLVAAKIAIESLGVRLSVAEAGALKPLLWAIEAIRRAKRRAAARAWRDTRE
jgi:hypothetical protein